LRQLIIKENRGRIGSEAKEESVILLEACLEFARYASYTFLFVFLRLALHKPIPSFFSSYLFVLFPAFQLVSRILVITQFPLPLSYVQESTAVAL
jgi:hypothetical protein